MIRNILRNKLRHWLEIDIDHTAVDRAYDQLCMNLETQIEQQEAGDTALGDELDAYASGLARTQGELAETLATLTRVVHEHGELFTLLMHLNPHFKKAVQRRIDRAARLRLVTLPHAETPDAETLTARSDTYDDDGSRPGAPCPLPEGSRPDAAGPTGERDTGPHPDGTAHSGGSVPRTVGGQARSARGCPEVIHSYYGETLAELDDATLDDDPSAEP